jgi:hypothetical protein
MYKRHTGQVSMLESPEMFGSLPLDPNNDWMKAYGHYPARVLADTIFRTRENLRYCKEHGIHLNGPKLGKPFADPTEARKHKKLEWLESGERGEIERNFGVGKRRYYYALT